MFLVFVGLGREGAGYRQKKVHESKSMPDCFTGMILASFLNIERITNSFIYQNATHSYFGKTHKLRSSGQVGTGQNFSINQDRGWIIPGSSLFIQCFEAQVRLSACLCLKPLLKRPVW